MKPILTNIAKYCFIIFLLNCFFTANAQTKENPVTKCYFQGGGGPSSKSGNYGELSLQAVVKNKWSFGLSYHDLKMKPKNLPSDYVPEWGYFLVIPFSNDIRVNMKLISVTAGKYFSLGRSMWFTTEAGLSLVNGEKVDFQPADNSNSGGNFLILGYYPSNYTTHIEKKTAIGGMLKADLSWAFCRFMGLSAGVFANINSIQSPIGFNTKLIIGFMGRHKKVRPGK